MRNLLNIPFLQSKNMAERLIWKEQKSKKNPTRIKGQFVLSLKKTGIV
jgi:hypothetical protein